MFVVFDELSEELQNIFEAQGQQNNDQRSSISNCKPDVLT